MSDYFNDAYEYAIMFSEESIKIGALLIDQRGNKVYASNEKGLNPIIDLFNKTKDRRQNKINYSESVIYVTDRLMDDETKEFLRYHEFKCVNYLMRGLLGSEDSRYIKDKEFFAEIGIPVCIRNRDVFINEDNYKEWWTNVLYDKAYDIVKDRKFPVTIPGYNRPGLPTLKMLKVAEYTEDLNWPFYVIVRESQYDMYVEATKQYKYVTIKSFPDKVIDNAGAVRRTTQKWLNSIGVKATFQMDDDVGYLGYSYAGRKDDGYPKAQYRRMKKDPFSSAKVLAMWQIAMEKAMALDDVVISCGQQIAFSWKDDYCRASESYRLMRGPMTQVVCFNIEKLCKEGIYHNNNAQVGFDDIDFTLRVIESGNKTCCFPWLVYGCEALGGGNGDSVSEEKLKERFKANQDKLKSLHQDKPYVSFRPKRGLDQVCIRWRNARKYLVDNFGYPESLIDKSSYDIWNEGELLKEAVKEEYKL